MKPNGYYLKTKRTRPPGAQSNTKAPVVYYTFDCIVCGHEHGKAHEAKACCFDLKPVNPTVLNAALDAATGMLKDNRLPPKRLPQPRTGRDNVKQPGPGNHWYRGNDPYKRVEMHYHRAQQLIRKYYDNEIIRTLEALCPSYTLDKPPRSYLQRIAWGFLTCMWGAVRNAVEEMEAEAYAQGRRDESSPVETCPPLKVDDLIAQVDQYRMKQKGD